MLFEGNNVVIAPEQLDARGAKAPPPALKTYEAPPVENAHRLHTDNFFACVRSRRQPNLHPLLGYQIMTAIALGVSAYRERRVKFFDPVARRVTEKAPARA